MKKILIILGGLIVLALVYWLVSPLFITREVNESLDDLVANTEIEAESGVVESDSEPESGIATGTEPEPETGSKV